MEGGIVASVGVVVHGGVFRSHFVGVGGHALNGWVDGKIVSVGHGCHASRRVGDGGVPSEHTGSVLSIFQSLCI